MEVVGPDCTVRMLSRVGEVIRWCCKLTTPLVDSGVAVCPVMPFGMIEAVVDAAGAGNMVLARRINFSGIWLFLKTQELHKTVHASITFSECGGHGQEQAPTVIGTARLGLNSVTISGRKEYMERS